MHLTQGMNPCCVYTQHFNTEPLLDCSFIFFSRLCLLLLAACYKKNTTCSIFFHSIYEKNAVWRAQKLYFYTNKVILKELLCENLTYLYMVHSVSFKDLKKNRSIRPIYSR